MLASLLVWFECEHGTCSGEASVAVVVLGGTSSSRNYHIEVLLQSVPLASQAYPVAAFLRRCFQSLLCTRPWPPLVKQGPSRTFLLPVHHGATSLRRPTGLEFCSFCAVGVLFGEKGDIKGSF